MRAFFKTFGWFVVGLCFLVNRVECMVPKSLLKDIDKINKVGSYGIVVPNSFEMNPLLQSSSFIANKKRPYIDISGKLIRLCYICMCVYVYMYRHGAILVVRFEND